MEVVVALVSGYVAVVVTAGMLAGDRYAREWGTAIIPLYSFVAITFARAGHRLLRGGDGIWKQQFVPLTAIVIFAGLIRSGRPTGFDCPGRCASGRETRDIPTAPFRFVHCLVRPAEPGFGVLAPH